MLPKSPIHLMAPYPLTYHRCPHPNPAPTNFPPRLPSKQCSTSPSSPPLMPPFPLTYHRRHLLPLSTLPPSFSSFPSSSSLKPSRQTTKSKQAYASLYPLLVSWSPPLLSPPLIFKPRSFLPGAKPWTMNTKPFSIRIFGLWFPTPPQ